MQRLEIVKNTTHVVLLGDDARVLERSMAYFAVNRVIVARTAMHGGSGVEYLENAFASRVTVVENVIDEPSILDIAMALMRMTVVEVMETGNDMYFNFTSPSPGIAAGALTCVQFAGITGYQSIFVDGKVDRVVHVPAFPVTKISADQFALLAILVHSSDFDAGFIVDKLGDRETWKIIFPGLEEKHVDDPGRLIGKINGRTVKTKKGAFLNSLDDLVKIVNPGIEKPSKQYNSERARLSYHLKQMADHGLVESLKMHRKIMLRASWTGIMFFMGTIARKLMVTRKNK